jgi:3-hydroxybutyryl-CoA dehydrogenase
MTRQLDDPDFTVGIVGAGAMGRGIAQVSVTGGMRALIYDSAAGAADKAVEFVGSMLDRAAQKERMSGADAEAAKNRLGRADSLADFAGADVVIEAVIEDLGIKHDVFRALEDVVGEDVVLASNTSSLRIAAIASACRNKSRVAGMHFFNPVPLMRLVEVIRAPETDDASIDLLNVLGPRMGRTPVVVQDAPGFLVNLGGRAFVTEGLRIATEGVASAAQIDVVMRESCGFRMGPFELMDLTGIDVNFPVSRIVYEGYFNDRRLATSPLHESLFMAGRFGRKTGAGYHAYAEDGARIETNRDAEASADPAPALVNGDGRETTADMIARLGAAALGIDDDTAPILCTPMGEDCTALAVRLGLDHRRLVAVDASVDWTKRATVMTAPGAEPSVRDAVVATLIKLGARVTAIKDSPGFIAQRIRAMVANLGCEMAQIGLAAPADIDTAMRLGLNYPQGPLELADAMGPDQVLAILEALQRGTGDDRYRPSLWLRRRGLLGLSASTPD